MLFLFSPSIHLLGSNNSELVVSKLAHFSTIKHSFSCSHDAPSLLNGRLDDISPYTDSE